MNRILYVGVRTGAMTAEEHKGLVSQLEALGYVVVSSTTTPISNVFQDVRIEPLPSPALPWWKRLLGETA